MSDEARHRTAVGVWTGVGLIVLGAVLATVFADVETPVVGLRQVGVVLAVIGVVDVVATLASRRR